MFGYVGDSIEELNMLYSALMEASRNDIVGKKYGYGSHDDGYGIVVYTESNLFHFRSTRPIYEEKFKLPKFDGKIYAVFHALNAYDRNLISPIFEHPFMVVNGDAAVYMAHNGVVDKQMIMDSLGIKGIYNDTEAALEYIDEKGFDHISDLENYTKSSLNLLILYLGKNRKNNSLYFKNYYIDKNKSDYLDMYTTVLPHGKAVLSSTLTMYGVKEHTRVTTPDLTNLEKI